MKQARPKSKMRKKSLMKCMRLQNSKRYVSHFVTKKRITEVVGLIFPPLTIVCPLAFFFQAKKKRQKLFFVRIFNIYFLYRFFKKWGSFSNIGKTLKKKYVFVRILKTMIFFVRICLRILALKSAHSSFHQIQKSEFFRSRSELEEKFFFTNNTL